MSEKRIVIGCDETGRLSKILEGLKSSSQLNCITTFRCADLIGLVHSLRPDLVILCFRNSQAVLDELSAAIHRQPAPILCLADRWESSKLSWRENHIVFTCPLEEIGGRDYLYARVNSILLLQNGISLQPGNSPGIAGHLPIAERADRSMSRYVLELDQKLELLSRVRNRIMELCSHVDSPIRSELLSILHSIKMSANHPKLWDDFRLCFEETDPGFLFRLTELYPWLTPVDLKYCCYLKMNMSNDDIRSLLGIDQKSVRTHKYRLKKKMSLTKDEDLRSHLRQLA